MGSNKPPVRMRWQCTLASDKEVSFTSHRTDICQSYPITAGTEHRFPSTS